MRSLAAGINTTGGVVTSGPGSCDALVEGAAAGVLIKGSTRGAGTSVGITAGAAGEAAGTEGAGAGTSPPAGGVLRSKPPDLADAALKLEFPADADGAATTAGAVNAGAGSEADGAATTAGAVNAAAGSEAFEAAASARLSAGAGPLGVVAVAVASASRMSSGCSDAGRCSGAGVGAASVAGGGATSASARLIEDAFGAVCPSAAGERVGAAGEAAGAAVVSATGTRAAGKFAGGWAIAAASAGGSSAFI
jgi:hypothetical protein